MATCKTAFCQKEGKVAGYCAQCYPAAKAAGMLDKTTTPADGDPVCKGGCGKRKSEVEVFYSKREMCKSCYEADYRKKKKEAQKPASKSTPPGKKTKPEGKSKGKYTVIPTSQIVKMDTPAVGNQPGQHEPGAVDLNGAEVVSFRDYPELYRSLQDLAKEEFRTPAMQILYILRTVFNAGKEG